eukprot:COSAG04_NODE_825_length_10050_cov_15.525676_3_plen_393_part_01
MMEVVREEEDRQMEQFKPGAATIFRWADANGDGLLGFDEVAAVCEFLGDKGLDEDCPVNLFSYWTGQSSWRLNPLEWNSKYKGAIKRAGGGSEVMSRPGLTPKQFVAVLQADAAEMFGSNEYDVQKAWDLCVAEASKGGKVPTRSDEQLLREAKEGAAAIFNWADTDDDGYLASADVQGILAYVGHGEWAKLWGFRVYFREPGDKVSLVDFAKFLLLFPEPFWRGAMEEGWDRCVAEASKGGKIDDSLQDPEQSKPGAAAVFEWIDADGDGHLGYDELKALWEFLDGKGIRLVKTGGLRGSIAEYFRDPRSPNKAVYKDGCPLNAENWAEEFKRPVGAILAPGLTFRQFVTLLRVEKAVEWFDEDVDGAQTAWDLCVAEASKGGKLSVKSDDQ